MSIADELENAADLSVNWLYANRAEIVAGLRAVERLRAALKEIAEYPEGQHFSAGFAPDDAEDMQDMARRALRDHEQQASGED